MSHKNPKTRSDSTSSETLKKALIKHILELDPDQLKEVISKVLPEKRIPISVFNNKIFTLNESIVKYLHEEIRLSFKEISVLTAKSNKTVWQLYQNAKKKSKKFLEFKEDPVGIPYSVLDNRTLSTLEIVVSYLMDDLGMSFSNIAGRLRRDYRTVWTAYKRAKVKNEKR